MQNIITEMWPRQNVRHFADDILKYIFFNENVYLLFNFNENVYILIIIWTNFIPVSTMC